ncbi:hypothetical protein TNCV_2126431 [Trichonephila clavipes]|nr:hypothetical protein TNCV_2126431 [Trichonephila clavipes]
MAYEIGLGNDRTAMASQSTLLTIYEASTLGLSYRERITKQTSRGDAADGLLDGLDVAAKAPKERRGD